MTRAERLLAALPNRTRLPLEVLWDAHATTFPELAGTADARSDLAALLDLLVDDGRVQLPSRSGGSWDRTARPTLPTFVTRIRPTAVSRESAAARLRRTILHPDLSAAYDLRGVTHDRVDELEAVSAWLTDGRGGAMVVPRQERSLQLFGDEKRLDTSIVGSALWGDRLLNDPLLATVEVTTPMPVWPTGGGSTLLIVENKATFWSAAQVLAGRGTPVGAVGWGQGGQVRLLLPSVADLPLPVNRVVYYGDVDRGGLLAAAEASQTAAWVDGLPPLTPATSLYRLLRDTGETVAADPVADVEARTLVGWLPEGLRRWAAGLLVSGRAARQEATRRDVLAANLSWVDTL